jgi:hypothetical protein
MIREGVSIAWFLWSTITPLGVQYMEKDIQSRPVKEFKSQAACEKALPSYREEIEKAFPTIWDANGYGSGYSVQLKCSPIYPR